MIVHNRALGFAPYAVMPCICQGRGVCIECQKWRSGRNLKSLGALVAGDVRGFGQVSVATLAEGIQGYIPPNNNQIYALKRLPLDVAREYQPPPPPVSVGRSDGVMQSSLLIRPNQFVASSTGKYKFMYTRERELVLIGPQEPVNGGFLWRQKTNHGPRSYVDLAFGTLRVFDPDTNRQTSFSWPNVEPVANSYAVMQDDGNFVVYAPGGKPTWATGTSYRARGCPPEEVQKLYPGPFPGIDNPKARQAWCDCKFLPGVWTDKNGEDALTRCKKDVLPNFAPWTNEGAGMRALPTGEGLVYAFLNNAREPAEEELELDYLCSLMFTDTARWAAIMCYCGFRAGGPTFLGPLGLFGTAFDGLWSLISAPFDQGKKMRYFSKMADVWFNQGLPMFAAGLGTVALVVAGTVAGTLVSPGLGTVIGAGAGLFLGSVALIIATGTVIENAAKRIEERTGAFRPPWVRRERTEIRWTEQQRLQWQPSDASIRQASRHWYPAKIAYEAFCSKLLDPGRYVDPLTTFLQDGCELAAALIPKTPIPDPEVESVRTFLKSLGRLAPPLVQAFVEKQGDAIKSDTTWATVGGIFDEASKLVEDAEVKKRLVDWADFFNLFKFSIARAAGYALEPTPENFKALVCCDVDSAFDKMPQAFVGQNMSALSKALDAILGKPVDGRVLTVEERSGFASVFVQLNASNLAKFLRLVARLIGFFNESIAHLKSLQWEPLRAVVDFLSMILTAISDALMQARAFILSLIEGAKSAPPVEVKEDKPPPKKTQEASKEDDGLLARLLLGAGGGFVLGGPPGAVIGAGAVVALTGK